LNSKLVNKFRKERITMVWPGTMNGENKVTKRCIRNVRDLWDHPEQGSSANWKTRKKERTDWRLHSLTYNIKIVLEEKGRKCRGTVTW
jgi:hypothetical protein